MRALLVANADDGDPGFVGHHLRRQGYAFTELLRERPAEWPAVDGADLVVLLGSEWSVYWPHVAASVDAEADLVRAAHARGVPLLGICFGGQVVAHALGGAAWRAPVGEIGWYDIDTDLPDVIAPGPWLQWHGDVVTVPPAAEELARSAVGPQAWRLGRTVCTQFHPEATETMLARWCAGGRDELAAFGTSGDAVMAATRSNVAISRKNANRLVDWFLETVAGS